MRSGAGEGMGRVNGLVGPTDREVMCERWSIESVDLGPVVAGEESLLPWDSGTYGRTVIPPFQFRTRTGSDWDRPPGQPLKTSQGKIKFLVWHSR